MPIPADLKEIFEKVYKATEEGRAKWEGGPLPEILSLRFSEFSVQLDRRFRSPHVMAAPPKGATPGWQKPPEMFRFRIVDDRGDTLDDFEAVEGDGEDFDRLRNLFEAARRSRSDVRDKLSNLSKQLSEKFG
jgi:hypothetical protein